MTFNFVNPHEQYCFDNATFFNAVRGRGAKRNSKSFEKIEDAILYASEFGDNITMIYAVTEHGHGAHITNA